MLVFFTGYSLDIGHLVSPKDGSTERPAHFLREDATKFFLKCLVSDSSNNFGVRIGVFYDFRALFSAEGQQPAQNRLYSWPLLAGVFDRKYF